MGLLKFNSTLNMQGCSERWFIFYQEPSAAELWGKSKWKRLEIYGFVGEGLRNVLKSAFICTCVFIQPERHERFPCGAFPGMRTFQSQWDLPGLALKAGSDGDAGRHE